MQVTWCGSGPSHGDVVDGISGCDCVLAMELGLCRPNDGEMAGMSGEECNADVGGRCGGVGGARTCSGVQGVRMGLNCSFVAVLVVLVLGAGCGELVSCSAAFRGPGNGEVGSQRGSALVLPLVGSQRSGRFGWRGRGLEEDARMALHDDLLTQGLAIELMSSGVPIIYYTSRVFIGTPPQEFALIVDTGSTVTYVPCYTCTHCGHHQDPRFKPDNSSSYQVVGCRSSDCITGMCDAKNRQCRYDRMYAEMSSSKGVLGKDLLGFGPTSRLQPQSLLFGCETAETGDLYLQRADGIMGLGRGPLSIVDQLVGIGAIEDAFSLCYGGMDEGGGSMVLGAIPTPTGMVFAKSDPGRSNYYNLELTEIQVQGVSLKLESSVFNGKFGTVLDSGTTYAYLPDRAFEAFRDAVTQQLGSLQAVDGPDPNYSDICYAGAGSDTKELGKHFPAVDLVFAENKKISLAPENYLFKHTKVPGAYCLGFFKNQDATTLLGGIVVRNMLVTYDRYNHQIGFLKTNCTDLRSILPAETAPPAVSPVNAHSPPVDSPTASPPRVNVPSPLSAQSPASLSDAEQEFGSIEIVIEVAANFTTFSNQEHLFLSSMATELDISRSQITIEDIKGEEEEVVVRCIISASSSRHFSSSSAKALAARLEGHTVQLPAIFGDYHLRSWKGLPVSRRGWLQSKIVKVGVIITVLVGLVVMLALAGLAYWFFKKFRDRDQVKYNNLNQVELTEQETLIGDQQL